MKTIEFIIGLLLDASLAIIMTGGIVIAACFIALLIDAISENKR